MMEKETSQELTAILQSSPMQLWYNFRMVIYVMYRCNSLGRQIEAGMLHNN